MTNEDLDKLVKELERLNLQQSKITSLQKSTLNKIKLVTRRLSEQQDIHDPPCHYRRSSSQSEDPFLVGSKVLITNKINHVKNRNTTSKDRAGTIHKITNSRICITTANGDKTLSKPMLVVCS